MGAILFVIYFVIAVVILALELAAIERVSFFETGRKDYRVYIGAVVLAVTFPISAPLALISVLCSDDISIRVSEEKLDDECGDKSETEECEDDLS